MTEWLRVSFPSSRTCTLHQVSTSSGRLCVCRSRHRVLTVHAIALISSPVFALPVASKRKPGTDSIIGFSSILFLSNIFCPRNIVSSIFFPKRNSLFSFNGCVFLGKDSMGFRSWCLFYGFPSPQSKNKKKGRYVNLNVIIMATAWEIKTKRKWDFPPITPCRQIHVDRLLLYC